METSVDDAMADVVILADDPEDNFEEEAEEAPSHSETTGALVPICLMPRGPQEKCSRFSRLLRVR